RHVRGPRYCKQHAGSSPRRVLRVRDRIGHPRNLRYIRRDRREGRNRSKVTMTDAVARAECSERSPVAPQSSVRTLVPLLPDQRIMVSDSTWTAVIVVG